MTWVDDEVKKRQRYLKQENIEHQKNLQNLKHSYSFHKDRIKTALEEIQKQGLMVVSQSDSPMYVNAQNGDYENIKVTFSSFVTKPWEFSATKDPDPDKSPGFIWKISHPSNENVCLWMCFIENQLIFRSGYRIYRVREFTPHRSANIFDTYKIKGASQYGLRKQITFYQDLGFYDHHILGRLPLHAQDSYGETRLGSETHVITEEHIIETVQKWFNFASSDA